MPYPAKFGFHSKYPTCDPRVLEEFERSLPGGALPAPYREFLLEWNGGEFEDSLGFPLKDSEDEDDFGRIYHFHGLFDPSDGFDLRKSSEGYGFRSDVPDSYIAIGDDHSLNRICLSVFGNDVGSVYWWTPGEPWPKQSEPTRDFLRPVTSSFQEFWRLLFAISDE